jgi:chaperonin cofactor prefoldin
MPRVFVMMQESPNVPQSSQPAQAAGVPRTRAELDALSSKRSELGNQLQSMTERRSELTEQLRHVSDAASARELESRRKMLDDRSARLEREILQADDGIAAALASGVAIPGYETSTTVPPRTTDIGGVIANVALVEGVTFVLLGLAFWRFLWKPALAKLVRHPSDHSSRLEQLQQAVDVIALEVERVSEGQRYVTKVLDERLRPSIGAGDAQQIAAKRKSAAPARTSDESA